MDFKILSTAILMLFSMLLPGLMTNEKVNYYVLYASVFLALILVLSIFDVI